MRKIKSIVRTIYYRAKVYCTNLFVSYSKIKLRKYKDKYKNQRCFIIGNGPSLTVEDLEKLQNEFTFASHGIYYVYDKTNWRPTFYCAQDSLLINERYSDIKNKCRDSQNFFAIVKGRNYPVFSKNAFGINLINDSFDEKSLPKFSNDPSIGFYEGMTVTYFNIQLAVYMGFKEIYLLGVDHFYAGGENDHFSKEDVCTNKPQTDKSTLAYVTAKKHADKNAIKIYNATRGGHLEIFERVNFADIKW